MQHIIDKLPRMSQPTQDTTKKTTEIVKGEKITDKTTPSSDQYYYLNGVKHPISDVTQGGKPFKPYKATPTPSFISKPKPKTI